MYLKNDNLVLRHAAVDDVQILCHWWSNGKIMAHAGFPNGIHTDADKLMDKIKNETDTSRRLIIGIDSNRVGEMMYRIQDDTAEMGIKICDFSYQEKGYGTKALKMLIGYLFKEMNVQKIILDTNLNNTRAQHVYEKIGFKKIGVRIDSWKNQLGVLQSSVDYELRRKDFMCTSSYAFVGYLDTEAEAQFIELWKNLSANNITQYGVETIGKRPHITIADYGNLDKDRFIKLLKEFYDNKIKVEISLNILGTFINTGTLFIAPTLSAELLDFHRDHHNWLKEFNENKNSFYLPGRWSPHCTIASRLNEENMLQAFGYCRNKISKFYAKLNEVALIEVKLNEDGIVVEDRVIFSKVLV
jgi:RimJ/RimL family protein N-acetyltransferase/2'-5' RNA ligase